MYADQEKNISIANSNIQMNIKEPTVPLNEQVILEKMDHRKTYYNSILSELKPKYVYKPRRAKLNDDGHSFRESIDLDYFNSVGTGHNGKPTRPSERKKKSEKKKDIKTIINKFFDVTDKKEMGSDQSMDWDKRHFSNSEMRHRASSSLAEDDYGDDGFY